MKNSENFYNRIKWYLDGIAQIESEYTAAVNRAAPFKGSPGGEAILNEATAARDIAVTAEKENLVRAIREIVGNMRDAARAHKITPPTQSQLAILEVLRMRKTVTKNEIQQAENNLKDCAIALETLHEIAHEHGIMYTGKREAMTIDYVLQRVNSMERAVYSMLNGGSSRPPADMVDCLSRFGGFSNTMTVDEWGVQRVEIDRAAVQAFAAIVDGEGADA